MRLALSICLSILFTACAADLRVHYPASPDETSTGTIVVLFSQPASDVAIAVNGVLVADDEHTQRVTIDHAPIGTVELTIAANGGDKTVRVWVSGDRVTTIPVGMPDTSASFLKTLFGSLVTIVVYSLLR
jgi:hypothetical protein